MTLPRSTPEAEGIASSAIFDFIRAADAQLDSLHSVMVVRHGAVVAEGWWSPYAAHYPHMMFSVSKSFTATAIGLAIDEGLVTLDDRVVELLPHDLPTEIDDRLSALTVRHLLTMTTGHATDTVSLTDDSHGDNWARTILAQPLEFTPGTHYVYNSGATHLLSAILQRVTGERLLDYLGPRLFGPLGITDATWESSPQGIDAGGWGLSITTEQLATFGQLLLQRGQWQGSQLVPAEWIDEATALQVDTSDTDHDLDGRQGYGYQFWRNRLTGYRADGAFGQFCLVLPEQMLWWCSRRHCRSRKPRSTSCGSICSRHSATQRCLNRRPRWPGCLRRSPCRPLPGRPPQPRQTGWRASASASITRPSRR